MAWRNKWRKRTINGFALIRILQTQALATCGWVQNCALQFIQSLGWAGSVLQQNENAQVKNELCSLAASLMPRMKLHHHQMVFSTSDQDVGSNSYYGIWEKQVCPRSHLDPYTQYYTTTPPPPQKKRKKREGVPSLVVSHLNPGNHCVFQAWQVCDTTPTLFFLLHSLTPCHLIPAHKLEDIHYRVQQNPFLSSCISPRRR